VPGSYTRRWRDINRIGAGAVPTCKYYNAVARYGEKTKVVHSTYGVLHVSQKVTAGMNVLHWETTWRWVHQIHFDWPQTEWCEICRQWGHIPPHSQHYRKYQKTTHTPFCEFYKSMGHDVNNYRSLQLMQDHTHDAFQVQEEKKVATMEAQKEVDTKEVLRGGYG
jgi:hypothetical protein